MEHYVRAYDFLDVHRHRRILFDHYADLVHHADHLVRVVRVVVRMVVLLLLVVLVMVVLVVCMVPGRS